MAKKEKKIFICSNCGKEFTKWLGRCPECGAWGSFEESIVAVTKKNGKLKKILPDNFDMEPLENVDFTTEKHIFSSGIAEFDRVLGGGFLEKSILLLSGGPGIGKSTLMLQVSNALIENGIKVLYISAEESKEQIKKRALRLGVSQKLIISNEEKVSHITAMIEKSDAKFIIVDSIQTIFDEELDSIAGTVSQVRNATFKLREAAHNNDKTILIIGHINKAGNIAGPMFLEHMVDVVLFFEGDNKNYWRILRSSKNRFGSTEEIGVFVMETRGLKEVKNPSTFFVDDIGELSGTVLTSVMEGVRPIFLEIQALVSKSFYPMPQRVVNGIDLKFVNIIVAVLEKKLNYQFGKYDIFLNITGGFKVKEPSIGLGVAMALISSFLDISFGRDTLFIGEIGLSGEIRNVPFLEKRIEEAKKMGYRHVVIPKVGLRTTGIRLTEAKNLKELVDSLVR